MEGNTTASPARRCCMDGKPPGLRLKVCGQFCVDRLRPDEVMRARQRARLITANRWIPADEWLDVMTAAREVDQIATLRGWKHLRRDPFDQVTAEISNQFLSAVANLHDRLTRSDVEPVAAIADLANTSQQIVALWLYVAEQRRLIEPTPDDEPKSQVQEPAQVNEPAATDAA